VPRSRPDRNDDAASPADETASQPDGDLPPRLALTERHLEILGHVARGRTNRQVGEILGISERTVRNHMRTIAKRLATADRTHAVVLAIGHGWISVPIEPEPSMPLPQLPRPAESPS
jgi:DNA-binding NarL/FixJ family response regulator